MSVDAGVAPGSRVLIRTRSSARAAAAGSPAAVSVSESVTRWSTVGRVAVAARRALAAVGVSALCLATLAPAQGVASSHREAPMIAGYPQLDNTDVYAFVSPDDATKVTILANWQPFEEPNGGPDYYPFAENTAFDINIDNNGDAKADITYRWTFFSSYRNPNSFLYNTGVVTSLSDADLNFRQTYVLQRITPTSTTILLNKVRAAPSFTGKASMPNYGLLSRAAVMSFADGASKSFAGPADDPFFADLRVFDLLYGGDLSETGTDSLRGYNVNTIGLQVSKYDLGLRGNPAKNPVIGIWSTMSRIGYKMSGGMSSGSMEQVSRLGNPWSTRRSSPSAGRTSSTRLRRAATPPSSPTCRSRNCRS
jgi:Domain of unknown function (DUF4331)